MMKKMLPSTYSISEIHAVSAAPEQQMLSSAKHQLNYTHRNCSCQAPSGISSRFQKTGRQPCFRNGMICRWG
jgi:hypothetical protein